MHYIRTNQYRLALDELDTYLTSYPYILSGPLHSYAGLLCFYLAQPESARAGVGATLNGGEGILDIEGGAGDEGDIRQQGSSEASVGRGDRFTDSYHGHERYEQAAAQAPNATLLKQARTWFIKAIEIAPDAIASEFIHLVSPRPFALFIWPPTLFCPFGQARVRPILHRGPRRYCVQVSPLTQYRRGAG